MLRIILRAAAIAALTVLIAGCGSTKDGSKTDTSSKSGSKAELASKSDEDASDEADAKDAYMKWDASFDKGDGNATCDAMSDAGRSQMVADATSSGLFTGKTCEDVVKFVADFTGGEITPSTDHSVEVDGDEATLHVTSVDGNQIVTMERDGDDWLVGKNAEDAAAGAQLVDKWLASWCSLKPGMTKAEASAVMGDPTGELDDPTSDPIPQLQWEQGAYSFTAFLDTGGKINQLQSDYSRLGASDRAKLTCEEVRK